MNTMPLTDNFSWRRVWMLWRLYQPALGKQLWIFPLASFVLSALAVLATVLKADFSPSTMGFTVGISVMYYFAPIALARRDARSVCDQLPVLTSEKMVFLILYFMIFMLVLTNGVQWLVYLLSSFIFPQFSDQMKEMYTLAMSVYPNTSFMFMSYVIGTAMPSLTLMGVILAKRNRMLTGILSCLGGYLAIVIISGIVGATMAIAKFREGFPDADFTTDIGQNTDLVVESMTDVIELVVSIVAVICVAIIVTCWTLIYKKVKRGGF